jgi:hypothetical protein
MEGVGLAGLAAVIAAATWPGAAGVGARHAMWIGRPQIFHLAAGAVILIVWALSGYRAAQSAEE